VDRGQGSKAVGEKKEDQQLCNIEIDLFKTKRKREKDVNY